MNPNEAWRCEILISQDDVQKWREEDSPGELAFVATAAKRQRAEVKMSTLSPTEKQEFELAKAKEVQNWVNTKTITRILRDSIPADQVLKCRWILTWKALDPSDQEASQTKKTHKAKARIVVLGYMDPQLTEIPRDSPTLSRHAKMLILQLISSMSWDLRSFDIKAAFLQGKTQEDRVIGLEPLPEFGPGISTDQRRNLQTRKKCIWVNRCPVLVVPNPSPGIAVIGL